jgi:two-component system, OmpR family, phosphate regulon sensor histidine kinase PhoR
LFAQFGRRLSAGRGRSARFSVPGQVRAALGASLIVLAGIVAVALYVPYELNESANERYVEDVIPLRGLVDGLAADVATQQAAAEEFLLTRDRKALKLYYSSGRTLNMTLAGIQPYRQRYPSLSRLLQEATLRIFQVQAALEAQISNRQLGRFDPEAPDTRDALRTADEAYGRLTDTIGDMTELTERAVAEAQDEQEATFQRLLVVLGWLGAVGLLIGGALFVITPRRLGELYAAEQRARREAESRADAARALAHTSDGVVLTDHEDAVRFSNPAASRLLETDTPAETGRILHELLPGWRSSGHDGAVVVPLTARGVERWLAITSVEFGDGVVYALRDVTEERALETMRSELLATASHELRTPMTSIYGAARTLLAHGDLAPERRETFLEMIASESERLARIVDGMLLASRLDADKVDVTAEEVNARELAESILESARVRAPENVTLRLDAPSRLPPVHCDPSRLRQVLLNLVDNAIKYSPDGGTIELSIDRAGDDALRFVVRDEGLGFPPDEAERIFDRFYRLDPGLTRGIGGTGLGLYISRELVERMSGSIWADSKPGRGSSFTVELPVAAESSSEAESMRPPSSVPGSARG